MPGLTCSTFFAATAQKCDPATNQMHPIRLEFRIQYPEEDGTGLAESLLLARVARLSETIGAEILAIVMTLRNCEVSFSASGQLWGPASAFAQPHCKMGILFLALQQCCSIKI